MNFMTAAKNRLKQLKTMAFAPGQNSGESQGTPVQILERERVNEPPTETANPPENITQNPDSLIIDPLEEFKTNYFAEEPVDLNQFEYFRAGKFPNSGPFPWLDSPNALAEINQQQESGVLSAEEAEYCRQWVRDGIIILKGAIDKSFLDRVWKTYEQKIAEGIVPVQPEKVAEEDPYIGRFLNTHFLVPEINEVLHHETILNAIQTLLGRKPKPFQTITSHKGSQQGVHSDSIHMTTYPLGYLVAAWVAFEDIHPDSGPLVYYPGSHRLPYLFSEDIGIDLNDFRERGYLPFHEKYEPAIQKTIQDHQLVPAYFHAEKGDVLIWHANLLHGGSIRNNLQYSRKAVVCHYFVEGAVCYHDLSGSRSNL
jgi:hypothetical protein